MPKHEMLTWDDLLKRISEMSDEERKDTATVHTQVLDEFYGVMSFGISKDGDSADGVLDHGHLYLEVDG